jgi:hypothetical protein
MKLKIAILALFCVSASFSLQAQTNDELDAMVTLLGMEKKQAINELVNITTKDSVNFWKVYGAFEAEQKKFRKERMLSYEKLVKAYDAMDDKTADELAKQFFALRDGQEKLLVQYYTKVKTATNASLAIQFYQAETYFLTLARANIMQQLPTYGQILKSKK